MRLDVHLHTILRRPSPDGPISRLEVSLPEGSTLGDLLQHLEIELPPESLLTAVNGRTAVLDQFLQNGDKVNLMPAISGGSIWG